MSRRAMHLTSVAAGEVLQPHQDTAAAAGDWRCPPPLFCPKPRRLAQIVVAGPGPELSRPSRWHAIHPAENFDSKAADLIDIILSKGSENNSIHVATSPPFFVGSPPARSANPVAHDARFGEDRPVGMVQPPGSPMSPTRKGCGPTKFAFKPATVRIEGFDCLERRDRSSRRITAVA